MQATLASLSERLAQAHIDPTPAGALGIYVRDDGIYLRPARDAHTPIAALQSSPPTEIRVMQLEDDQDPRVLYLLPWDPSIGLPDEVERRALEERVRSALAALIGSQLDALSFQVSLDEILQAAVEVWDVWRDRQATAGLRNAVRRYVKQILDHLCKMQVDVKPHQDTFTFSQVTPQIAQDVRHYLTSVAFRRGEIDLWSEAVQLDFGSLADGW